MQIQMHKTIDTRYHYRGLRDAPSFCRLRLFHDPDRPPILILSEHRDNPGTSVACRIEAIATDAWSRFGLDPINTMVLIHYPSGTFADHRDPPRYQRVVFDVDRCRRASAPRYGTVEPEWVEELIGHELHTPPASESHRAAADTTPTERRAAS